MKLEDLKVIDIIQMPQFEKHIEALIKDLYLTRTKIMNEHPGVQFKRGPIERLQEKKVFGPKALAALYAKVVDKTINTSEYPSTLRTFIKGILCNFIVCAAAFVGMKLKEETAKTFIMMIIVMTFVLPGFEHSIANYGNHFR